MFVTNNPSSIILFICCIFRCIIEQHIFDIINIQQISRSHISIHTSLQILLIFTVYHINPSPIKTVYMGISRFTSRAIVRMRLIPVKSQPLTVFITIIMMNMSSFDNGNCKVMGTTFNYIRFNPVKNLPPP